MDRFSKSDTQTLDQAKPRSRKECAAPWGRMDGLRAIFRGEDSQSKTSLSMMSSPISLLAGAGNYPTARGRVHYSTRLLACGDGPRELVAAQLRVLQATGHPEVLRQGAGEAVAPEVQALEGGGQLQGVWEAPCQALVWEDTGCVWGGGARAGLALMK